MAKIEKYTEDKIKAAARITDVFAASGIQLHRRGASLVCLCPFHDDHSLGSFVVNPRKNYYKCFSCGASGDPIKFLEEYEHMRYPDALRYLASMYNIFIDDNEPVPVVEKHEPRQPLPETKMAYWKAELVKPYMHHAEDNNLLKWMLSLPLKPEHARNLRNAIELYLVGTSLQGYTKGWVIWPQLDTELRLRDMKLMAYMPDGHRDKSRNPNWMRAMLERAGQFNPDTHHVEHCLFGLHLAKMFPKAEVCLVESEKTAVLCSAFTDPSERLWMATGGMQGFKIDMLMPLIETKRDIVLYPDIDGYKTWEDIRDAINYPRISISQKPKQLHILADGPKADIADIMVRTMHGIKESTAEIVARRLNAPDKVEVLDKLINSLGMEIEV